MPLAAMLRVGGWEPARGAIYRSIVWNERHIDAPMRFSAGFSAVVEGSGRGRGRWMIHGPEVN